MSVSDWCPSYFNGEKNLPVEKVSWIDAVVFCNELSVKEGLKPCYSYKENSNAAQWKLYNYEMGDWSENLWENFNKNFTCDTTANGYRLPAVAGWQYAAKGGQDYEYSGSDNLDEVGWYDGNSGYKTHPVAQKKPNDYGLYDMSGNVLEWCWWDSSSDNSYKRCTCGGGWYSSADYCGVGDEYWSKANNTDSDHGFRVVRSTGK